MEAKRPIPRHIIIKMPKVKDKERNLQSSNRKVVIYLQGSSIRLSADFTKETLQAGRDWREIFKVMKSRALQLRLPYPAKLSFRIKGQIMSSSDKKI